MSTGIIRNLDIVQAILNTTLDENKTNQADILIGHATELTTALDRLLKALNTKVTPHLPDLETTELTPHLHHLLRQHPQPDHLTNTTTQLLRATKHATGQEPLHIEHQPGQITTRWPNKTTWTITPAVTTTNEPLNYPLINLTQNTNTPAGKTSKHYRLAHHLITAFQEGNPATQSPPETPHATHQD